MYWIYSKTETDTEIVYTYHISHVLLFLLILTTVALSIHFQWFPRYDIFIALATIIFIYVSGKASGKIAKHAQEALQKGTGTMMGKKWSLKHPLQVIIKK